MMCPRKRVNSIVRIRKEVPGDAAAIEAVTIAAFQDAAHTEHAEQFIVNALRKSDQLSISLVAEQGGAIIGHVAVSPVSISSELDSWIAHWQSCAG